MTAPTLTDFLLARYDEDEEWARSVGGDYAEPYDPGTPGHHDRILAECEAKRRIVKEARNAIRLSDETHDDGSPKAERIHGYATAWESAIDTLAAVYADHPDYREEWKP